MGYNKGPVGHMKASTENKAVGYMAEGSAAYMSALHQTEPRDGSRLQGVVGTANYKKPKTKEELMKEHKYLQSDKFKNEMARFRSAESQKTADSLGTIRDYGNSQAKRDFSYIITPPSYDNEGGEVISAGIIAEPSTYLKQGANAIANTYGSQNLRRDLKDIKNVAGESKYRAMEKTLDILEARRK